MTHRELLERIAAANSGVAAVEAIEEFENEVIERCSLAARGDSNKLDWRSPKLKMYWEGRRDAATDVRQLGKPSPEYPCDCQSNPHHPQCNSVRRAYTRGQIKQN